MEILCFASKNLKAKNTHFQSYEDFVIFVHSSDLCCSYYEQVSTQVLCRHFFLTYSLVYITDPVFLPFLNTSSVQKMEENKNLQIRIQSWEHYAVVLQSYKVAYYFI